MKRTKVGKRKPEDDILKHVASGKKAPPKTLHSQSGKTRIFRRRIKFNRRSPNWEAMAALVALDYNAIAEENDLSRIHLFLTPELTAIAPKTTDIRRFFCDVFRLLPEWWSRFDEDAREDSQDSEYGYVLSGVWMIADNGMKFMSGVDIIQKYFQPTLSKREISRKNVNARNTHAYWVKQLHKAMSGE